VFEFQRKYRLSCVRRRFRVWLVTRSNPNIESRPTIPNRVWLVIMSSRNIESHPTIPKRAASLRAERRQSRHQQRCSTSPVSRTPTDFLVFVRPAFCSETIKICSQKIEQADRGASAKQGKRPALSSTFSRFVNKHAGLTMEVAWRPVV